MDIALVIAYISAGATAIPSVIGFKNSQTYSLAFKLLLVYTACGILGEIASIVTVLNAIPYHAHHAVYVTIEGILIFSIYYHLLVNKYVKISILVLGILSVLYKIIFTVTSPEGLNTPEDNFRTAVSFITITAALFLFYQLLRTNESEEVLHKNPVFWLNTGFLVYFMFNLFNFMIESIVTTKLELELAEPLFVLHSITNIVMNLFLGYSFWLCRTKKN